MNIYKRLWLTKIKTFTAANGSSPSKCNEELSSEREQKGNEAQGARWVCFNDPVRAIKSAMTHEKSWRSKTKKQAKGDGRDELVAVLISCEGVNRGIINHFNHVRSIQALQSCMLTKWLFTSSHQRAREWKACKFIMSSHDAEKNSRQLSSLIQSRVLLFFFSCSYDACAAFHLFLVELNFPSPPPTPRSSLWKVS